jgi:hypothetical protein
MPLQKNSYGTQNAYFRKYPLKHCKVALKEDFTVFIFCLALKKKSFCAVGEYAQPCLAYSPTALNELNLAVAPPFVGQMKKNFISFLSTPFGTD